mmetsp:Transcript_65356/g.160922  ORF Transcript_65356/g.160922 Transcript_65356/m.160922 type:complete len:173 (-) Transcript_65356:1138-1656(-)
MKLLSVLALLALVGTTHAFHAFPALRMSVQGARPSVNNRSPVRSGIRLERPAGRSLSALRAENQNPKVAAASEEFDELKETVESAKKSVLKLIAVSFTVVMSTIKKYFLMIARWLGRTVGAPFQAVMKQVRERADTDMKIVKDKVTKEIDTVKKMEVDMLEQRLKKARGDKA